MKVIFFLFIITIFIIRIFSTINKCDLIYNIFLGGGARERKQSSDNPQKVILINI